MINDIKLFKKCGGGTVVENTTHGLQRDLDLIYRVAKDTGVNIIAGTGEYDGVKRFEISHPVDSENKNNYIPAQQS